MSGAATGRVRASTRPERERDQGEPMEVLREIRAETISELASCRIVAEALAGKSRREDYVAYLTNVYHYARFSPVIMAAAAARSVQTHPELSLYLLRHAAEEQGHDGWALEDLGKLGVSEAEVAATRPTPCCAALVGYVHDLATSGNPIATFGWMYILEAVGADIGTVAGEQLGNAHEAADGPVKFVAGHGVADTDHSTEIEEQIRTFVKDPEDRATVCETARVVSHLYTTMFRQIGGEEARWESP